MGEGFFFFGDRADCKRWESDGTPKGQGRAVQCGAVQCKWRLAHMVVSARSVGVGLSFLSHCLHRASGAYLENRPLDVRRACAV